MKKAKVVSFILNYLEIPFELPQNLNKQVTLRKPTEDELTLIKKNFSLYKSATMFTRVNFYEKKNVIQKNGSSHELIPKNEWKYFVLEAIEVPLPEIKNIFKKLQFAFKLIENDLQLAMGITFFDGEPPSYTMNPLRELIFYNNDYPEMDQKINLDEFQQAMHYLNLIENLKEEHQFIISSIENFDELENLPNKSYFKTLGYFTIIEQLITHRPKKSDSILKQMKTNIPKINSSLSNKINFNLWFENHTESQIVTNLYEFRSSIAHGRKFSFKGKSKIFLNKILVQKFMKDLVKKVIISALHNPEFTNKIKEGHKKKPNFWTRLFK